MSNKSILGFAILVACISFIPVTADAKNDLQGLAGYNQEELLPDFIELLQRDSEVYTYFKSTPRAFEVVRRDRALQQKLVARTVKPQAVLVQLDPIDQKAEADLQQLFENTDSQPVRPEADKPVDRAAENTPAPTPALHDLQPSTPVTVAKPDAVDYTAGIRPPAMEDINAVPTDTSLDTKGWPKYLRTPDGCPAARDDIEYIHHAVVYNRRNLSTPIITPFIHHGQVLLTDNQAMTFPVITPNSTINTSLDIKQPNDGAFGGVGTTYQISYSYCPGDMTGFTPEGEPPLAAGCVRKDGGFSYGALVRDLDSSDRPTLQSRLACVLEPNKRYFVTIMPKAGDPCLTAINRILSMEAARPQTKTLFASYLREVKGKQVGLCSQLFTGSISTPVQRAPYAGPCLSQGPYPLNYNSFWCGQGVAVPACEAVYARGENFQRNCYDTAGDFPPVEFAHACAENKGSWIKGYRVPVSATHSCETMPVSASGAVCAKHNEGKTRTLVCRRDDRNGVDENYIISGQGRQEKCVFNAAHKRYEWVKISGSDYNGTAGVEACTFEGDLQ